MASIKIIPAMPHADKAGSSVKEKPKLRVAAYCRVSTDTDEQATSYVTQVEHYTEYISRNPEWTLAGIYADDGISGTNTKNRVEFNRMMDDCGAGRIDMIITKSISRFARNTLDCLKHIRALKAQNIPVYFEKESINTLDAKGEVLLTIMASLAQQESQSLSQNVKLGLQYRYQQGKVQVNHSRFLGYTKDAEGNLIIDPEQAEIVRRIYREYLEGYSMDRIKAGLERDGIPTGSGSKVWYTSTINKILRNEKYIGDTLLQKTYTTDFLNKTRVKNNGIMPQYYVEGNHEAIIPKHLFLKVQDELVRRITCVTANGRKCGFSSHHAFSQIVFCCECGENFRRTQWNNRGKKSVVWRCLTRLYPKKTKLTCHARTVKEDELKAACLSAFNGFWKERDGFQEQMERNIERLLAENNPHEEEKLRKQEEELQQELINLAEARKNYSHVVSELQKVRELQADLENNRTRRNETVSRIRELKEFIRSQSSELTEFDETLVRHWIRKITVHPDWLTIEFKTGDIVEVGKEQE